MGKDKLRRFQENKSFTNLYEPRYDEVHGKDHPLKGFWAEKVFGNNNPIILELGCGKGNKDNTIKKKIIIKLAN